MKAYSVMDVIKQLVEQVGTTTEEDNKYYEIKRKDTVTGEAVSVRVGVNSGNIFFAEELGVDNQIISRAEIKPKRGMQLGDMYEYNLQLQYTGGRYQEQGAEIDIKNNNLPHATVKVMNLLTSAVMAKVAEEPQQSTNP